MNKEYLILFILKHDSNAEKKKLEAMSVEALFMISVQIEIGLLKQKGLTN